jgi:hypothetical protein
MIKNCKKLPWWSLFVLVSAIISIGLFFNHKLKKYTQNNYFLIFD